MALQFIFGNPGSGKSHYLYEHIIRESMKHPDINYIILVPEQFTMQTQKELVLRHPRHGIMNIDVLSFARLAFRVLEETGNGSREILDDEGKNLILRRLAGKKEDSLKVLKGNIKKPGYISEVKSVISELTQYNISPDGMDDMITEADESSYLAWKLKDIQVMYQAFEEYLADKYITKEEILDILSFYGVSAVELGVQSLDEEVLKASGRRHSVKDTADACARIKQRGCFLLGCQMMLGLPASTREKELLTAREICRIGADCTRIYPTVVLKDTPLEALWKKGLYRPLSLEEGVLRGADCFEIFENAGVKVLRMGLCAEESCREQAVAGCYHPAYGELVYNRLYLQKLRRMLEENPPAKGSLCRILLPKGELSLAIGQKKCNKEELERIFSCRLKFEEWDALPKGQPKILRNEQ